jgi:hypothetical protein
MIQTEHPSRIPGHPREPEVIPKVPNIERPEREIPEVEPMKANPEISREPPGPEILPEESPHVDPPDLPQEIPTEIDSNISDTTDHTNEK